MVKPSSVLLIKVLAIIGMIGLAGGYLDSPTSTAASASIEDSATAAS